MSAGEVTGGSGGWHVCSKEGALLWWTLGHLGLCSAELGRRGQELGCKQVLNK